eukprot:150880-Hanusia_phi.AAC.1
MHQITPWEQQYGEELLPVAFFSKRLNPAERNYSLREKELLGLITSLLYFKSRCLDEIQAFESELEVIAGSGKDLTFTSQTPVTYESMFFSQEDILKGKNRAPFKIMALIELNCCKRLCYGSASFQSSSAQPDRCFMASGVNSKLQVEFKGYCIPADPRISIYEGAEITDVAGLTNLGYVVSGSEAWSGDIYRMYFISKDHLDTTGSSTATASPRRRTCRAAAFFSCRRWRNPDDPLEREELRPGWLRLRQLA